MSETQNTEPTMTKKFVRKHRKATKALLALFAGIYIAVIYNSYRTDPQDFFRHEPLPSWSFIFLGYMLGMLTSAMLLLLVVHIAKKKEAKKKAETAAVLSP